MQRPDPIGIGRASALVEPEAGAGVNPVPPLGLGTLFAPRCRLAPLIALADGRQNGKQAARLLGSFTAAALFRLLCHQARLSDDDFARLVAVCGKLCHRTRQREGLHLTRKAPRRWDSSVK